MNWKKIGPSRIIGVLMLAAFLVLVVMGSNHENQKRKDTIVKIASDLKSGKEVSLRDLEKAKVLENEDLRGYLMSMEKSEVEEIIKILSKENLFVRYQQNQKPDYRK